MFLTVLALTNLALARSIKVKQLHAPQLSYSSRAIVQSLKAEQFIISCFALSSDAAISLAESGLPELDVYASTVAI